MFMGSFGFWQKWLFSFGLYLIAFGFVLAFFSRSALLDFVFNNQIDPAFWGSVELSENVERFRAWIYGVPGAVITGWVVSFIVYYPFNAKEQWAWNCIAAGFVVWFIIDTVISVYYGVGFNVFINIAFLLFVSLPLLFTRKYFKLN